MPSQDFDFANVVCSYLGSRAERDGIQSLPEPQRSVLLVWWAQGIIGNGGFEYFYEGACNMAEVAEAFLELGFSEASQACRQSMALFPLEILGGDPKKCYEWMTQFDEDYIKEVFLPLSRVIWATNDNDQLSRVVAEYIRDHMNDFSEAL